MIQEHRILLFCFLGLVYFFFSLWLIRKVEIEDLKENGGIVISGKITDKLAKRKSYSQLRVSFREANKSVIKWIDVSNENYASKKIGDTVLILISSNCRSLADPYELYPTKAEIKKCLNGCEYVYGDKGELKAL